jgi:phenylalanyl-tRNA synthetase beta subunit
MAKIHPDILKEWDLSAESYVLELDFPRSNAIKFKAISNTPAILRDITVDSKLGLESHQLISFIKKNTPKTLKEIKVSGLFVRDQGNLELENNKSTTLSLLWQDDNDTLKGEEIDSSIQTVKNLLEKELSVTFRA